MTVIDFIDLSDHDIIDLSSSDDEAVQEDQIATQHRAASLDKQDVFVLAGEGSRAVQAVFVAAGEGSQDEQAVFVAASEGSQDRQAMFVAASEGRQEASEPGHALEATASSMIMEEAPLVAATKGSQDVHPVFVAASEGRQETTESGHALEATAKSVRVKAKYHKKNYHTGTPRKSPRLIQMGECCTSPVEEPAADYKRSRTLGPAEESVASIDSAETVVLALPHAGSTNCLRSPTSATFPSLISTSPTAVTSEGGDAKLVRVKAKHPERNYHILSLVREKSPLGPTSTSPKALFSEDGDAKLVTGKVKRRRKNCRPCKLTP
ncbi:hypothetical protein CFC21_033542 [Triticum aestivum]|uniref:Uncharacterized protein n=2 Tax=Triticum aestivum TaxID=4565 RepID=A0A9R1F2D1_WHEAT|nr:hypothetical protein CFC21_033542 [Triticum aestivum]